MNEFKNQKIWKQYIFKNVCGNAWNNDWNKIKNSSKTKLFFNLNEKYFKNKKYYQLNNTIDYISGMDESVGVRWLFLIWSGHTPLDYTTTMIKETLIERKSESIYKRKIIWKSKNAERMNKWEFNNGCIIRHNNFKLNNKMDHQNKNIEMKYSKKSIDLSKGDYVTTSKKVQIKKYQHCLWCYNKWEDPIKLIFNNCSKLSKFKEQFNIVRGVEKNFVIERSVLVNTVKFLNEIFKHQSI